MAIKPKFPISVEPEKRFRRDSLPILTPCRPASSACWFFSTFLRFSGPESHELRTAGRVEDRGEQVPRHRHFGLTADGGSRAGANAAMPRVSSVDTLVMRCRRSLLAKPFRRASSVNSLTCGTHQKSTDVTHGQSQAGRSICILANLAMASQC